MGARAFKCVLPQAAVQPAACYPKGRRYRDIVIRCAGVEGRAEVDEVNAGVRHVLAEDLEVVAEVELVPGVHLDESITQTDAPL